MATPAPSSGRSYYGFVLYLFGWGSLLAYLVWALVPHTYLATIGLTYLPQPYWAVAAPSLLITLLLTFMFLIYPSINLLLTVPPDDLRTLVDVHTVSLHQQTNMDKCGVPPAYDLPLTEVCRSLYTE